MAMMNRCQIITPAFLVLIAGTLCISCRDPRVEFNNNMKSWIGKPIGEFIQVQGIQRGIRKIPTRHDVYIFGGTKTYAYVVTRNPQVISTTMGGNSTTNLTGNIYSSNNYATGNATTSTIVNPSTTVTTYIPGSSEVRTESSGCEIWIYVKDNIIINYANFGRCF